MNKILSIVHILFGLYIAIFGTLGVLVLSGVIGRASPEKVIFGSILYIVFGLFIFSVGIAIGKKKQWGYVAALLVHGYLFISGVVPTVQFLLNNPKELHYLQYTLFQPAVLVPFVVLPLLVVQFFRKRREKNEARFVDSKTET